MRRRFDLMLGRNGQPKPVLAARDSWYRGSTAKTAIQTIEILDEYRPDGTETERWNADGANMGAVKCFVKGTRLILAGNGYGKIYANPDSTYLFSGSTAATRFSGVTEIHGAPLLDTSEVTVMDRVFDQDIRLEAVDLSQWDVSRVTGMVRMFQLCKALKELDLSRWDVSNVLDFTGCFLSVSSQPMTFRTLGDISRWDVSKCRNFTGMFQACFGLTKLDLSGWDTGSATAMSTMFSSMAFLRELTLGERFTFNGAGNTRLTSPAAPQNAAIPGADGFWYTADGTAYAPDQIPNYTAATYYAVKPV